jgi:hypothetical protein
VLESSLINSDMQMSDSDSDGPNKTGVDLKDVEDDYDEEKADAEDEEDDEDDHDEDDEEQESQSDSSPPPVHPRLKIKLLVRPPAHPSSTSNTASTPTRTPAPEDFSHRFRGV